MLIRYTMVCARSNRRGTYVDAMQCICNVKHSCARRVLLTSQGTLTYISWMLQQYSAFSSLPSCSLSFYRVFQQRTLQYQLKRSVMCIFSVLHFLCLFIFQIFCNWFHSTHSHVLFFSLLLFVFAYCVYAFRKYVVTRFLSRIITLNGQHIACQ